MKQECVFFPHPLEIGKGPAPSIPMEREPSRVWTLFRSEPQDPNEPPELPIVPVHMRNAFLEDRGHDWAWKDGQFRYFSRISSGSTWLLLEYKD